VEVAYELVLGDGEERVVASDKLIDVGDALLLDGEVWLVLRESERDAARDKAAATRARARFHCRRALRLRTEARDLVAYAEELRLNFTQVRDAQTE
jgi:hypothetical protein